MGEHGTLSFIPPFGAFQAGEAVTVQALTSNLTAESQRFALGFKVYDPGLLHDSMTGLKQFAPLQRMYLSATFPMPPRSVIVDIALYWFDPQGFAYVLEELSQGWGVPLYEPQPTPTPAPPSTPSLPLWLRVLLLSIPIIGESLLLLAEWLTLNTQAVETWAKDLLAWIAKVEVDAAENSATMGEWIELSSGRFAGNYEQWEAGTLAKAKSLIETSEESVVGQLLDWLNPLNLWKETITPALSTIDAFLGDPWDWLKDRTPLGDLLTLVQIMWDTLVALPENWSNFFWLPIDFLLNALDYYLYEEVDPND